jgi:predicted AAA+ superfamily ATPase
VLICSCPVTPIRDSFIVFIDDLSFESNETEYKYLKYILEGGVEVIPENVVIYATSNRRHLVRESWQDRDEGTEVRVSDSLSEKLSLADRFGITVTFTSPDQEEYLKIVEGLAEKSKLEISKAELREKALWWERWHNGRSGRTAKQFINSLLSEL